MSGLILCALAVAAEGAGVWLDVPYVSQEKNGCGAASIAMVMQYWRHTADASEIQRTLYSRQAKGISASDLQRYFQQHGFQAFAVRGEWDDLQHHLKAGRPLIVALKSGRDAMHYVVITGLDPQEGIVLTHDPARRKLLKQHRAEFEKGWKATGNWTLLALPSAH